MSRKTIYFLCTGNSCRSQMAEAWAKEYLSDDWEVKSAGIEAHGLNPKAVGMDEEKWVIFQRVRDEIGERIKRFVETGR